MSLSDFGFIAGTIPEGETQVVVAMPVALRTPIVTATLTSIAPTRAIEVCTDGTGANFFVLDYLVSPVPALVLVTPGPVTHIRFTGAADDPYRVQA